MYAGIESSLVDIGHARVMSGFSRAQSTSFKDGAFFSYHGFWFDLVFNYQAWIALR